MVSHWLTLVVVFELFVSGQTKLVQASSPPRGFNTFDGYGNGDYNETDIIDISKALHRDLLPTGFEYMVLDGGWQRDNFTNEGKRPVLGPYGHPYPSVGRFPSAGSPGSATNPGVGFAPLAQRVHAMGLKFGVWVIKGVYKGAAAAKIPIKGTQYTLDQIIDQKKGNGSCVWAGDWLGINASHPGAQPFYDSLIETLASWEVDFVKVDCIFGHGPNGIMPDIAMIAKAIRKVKRPIALSLSPGGGIHPSDAAQVVTPNASTAGNAVPALDADDAVGPLATMYRVTNDFHGGFSIFFVCGEPWGEHPAVCKCSSVVEPYIALPDLL
jgi:hypothetical protein